MIKAIYYKGEEIKNIWYKGKNVWTAKESTKWYVSGPNGEIEVRNGETVRVDYKVSYEVKSAAGSLTVLTGPNRTLASGKGTINPTQGTAANITSWTVMATDTAGNTIMFTASTKSGTAIN